MFIMVKNIDAQSNERAGCYLKVFYLNEVV